MARRLKVQPTRLTTILAVLVIVLGGLSFYAVTQGARFGPKQPTPAERALTQVKAQMGPNAEVRYIEAGKRRAVCGYAGIAGERRAVAFVSRPNRILMGDDPLRAEFSEMKAQFCPGFNPAPPTLKPAATSVSVQG